MLEESAGHDVLEVVLEVTGRNAELALEPVEGLPDRVVGVPVVDSVAQARTRSYETQIGVETFVPEIDAEIIDE